MHFFSALSWQDTVLLGPLSTCRLPSPCRDIPDGRLVVVGVFTYIQYLGSCVPSRSNGGMRGSPAPVLAGHCAAPALLEVSLAPCKDSTYPLGFTVLMSDISSPVVLGKLRGRQVQQSNAHVACPVLAGQCAARAALHIPLNPSLQIHLHARLQGSRHIAFSQCAIATQPYDRHHAPHT